MVSTRCHKELGALELAFPRDAIQERIKGLAREIEDCYKAPMLWGADHGELLLVGVLKGARPFVCALGKELRLLTPSSAIEVRYVRVRTRNQGKRSSEPCILQDVPLARGRNILLADDIIDGGETLRFLALYFAIRGARTIRVCTLLQKENSANSDHFVPDFIGFKVKRPEWVVGFGLDYKRGDLEIGRRMSDIWYMLGTGVG